MEINCPHSAQKTKNHVEKWNQLFAEDLLAGSHFREHWRIWVPRTFISPGRNEKGFEWEVKEDILQNVLIGALEDFMCNGNAAEFFNFLSANAPPPSVCGKVFKMGEPSYNCRDCSTDVTCVLCVNCFQQSIHRYHKYKMGTSMGGGCCDCGDVEAWKCDPFCDSHIEGFKVKDENTPEFPEDLVKRTECVFNAVLQYCSDILTLDYYPGLPRNLRLREEEDPEVDLEQYCTLLYDHESYTFEEVASTLATVLNCSHKSALEYVTCIDRDGRTIVKCSNFHYCNELKQNIEKITSRHGSRPLEVVVVQSQVVAHQMFALHLLNWLLKLINLSKRFRKIFTTTALNLDPPSEANEDSTKGSTYEKMHPSFVEGILLQDSFLWKMARLHWHRLFIAGFFMEYENKKAFAKVFTRHYSAILKNFIREDHDYSFSFASLSIQIFTVPTLAFHLIAHEDVLFKLLNTFVAECSRKRNDLGRLEFSRSSSLGSFRRAMNILQDLRYLLHCPPCSWTSELRRGFLKGINMILNLLNYMQEMNPVRRQVDQHLEYEPEWETAFTLQTKLSSVITLIHKWCSTDQIVFMKVYRQTLKKLFENCHVQYRNIEEVKAVGNYKATCYNYDVSTQPVSIHLPLSRFLAGLFLLLEKFGFLFYSDEFIALTKPTPKQIIEAVIRTQVMIAQVQAGMWRKNGYSLSNQIYYYHSVKCRKEMQDKDIVILQFGASLIESNEFIIHLLNKFKLINWANPDFETTIFNTSPTEYLKTSPKIVEEFLSLLISIISERYVPGVGKVTENECLKNEIIHQLFIRPLSHSELNKSLPDDVNPKGTTVEELIDEVAYFSKPAQSSSKGVYKVKQEFVDKYNVFFHHYSKEDMSKSEEEQRKQRKVTNGYECCLPPILPSFTASLENVLNLLQCDLMLYIIKLVVERTLDISSRSTTEGQLHAVLHLIGYGLQEQERNSVNTDYSTRVIQCGIKDLLETLYSSPRVEAHKDLMRWILDKLTATASPQQQIGDGSYVAPAPVLKENDDLKIEKSNRAKLAAEKKAAILAQMASLQQSFMKENAALFQADLFPIDVENESTAFQNSDLSPLERDFTIALGSEQSTILVNDEKITCILCQDDQAITSDGPALIHAAYLQSSATLVRERDRVIGSSIVLGFNVGPAVHLSTCGHTMHISCWKKYINTIIAKQNRRPYRLLKQPTAFDIEKNEYLCPLCERLSNTVLPLLPQLSFFCPFRSNSVLEMSYNDWYNITLIVMGQNGMTYEEITSNYQTGNNFQNEQITAMETETIDSLPYLTREAINAEETMSQLTISSSEVTQGGTRRMSQGSMEVVNLFIEACSKHDCSEKSFSSDERCFRTWRICAYTIHSIEWLLRHTNRSLLGDFTLREKEGLGNLIRLSGAASFMIGELDLTKKISMQLLNMLFNDNGEESILEWDSLGILIPLTVSMPSIYCRDLSPIPLGRTVEKHCFKTAFLLHIAQIIICTDLSRWVFLPNGDLTCEDTECLAEIVRVLKDCQGVNTIKIWDIIKSSSLNFLRCSTIFFHFLTDVPAPKSLKEIEGDTYESIMNYLGMTSSCRKLLAEPAILSIFQRWAKHRECVNVWNQVAECDMMAMNHLMPLPQDYSEIINAACSFVCPNSDNEDVRSPTLCLLCGKMLCSETYCCQQELNRMLVGSCTYHAQECGSGVGIFLRIRDCEVLLLADIDKGCFMAAPYIDEYGETDQGLKRGNPMHFCKELYRELEVLWLSHGVQEHIARSIEQNLNIIHTQWHHF